MIPKALQIPDPELGRDRVSSAWYALRRTLPPWSFEQNLTELIQWLPKYGVDELIVKIDTEEFSHGQPDLRWIRQYRPKLAQIAKEMEKLGIVYSLNPWITLGHIDRGRDSRPLLPGLQPIVGHDGAEPWSEVEFVLADNRELNEISLLGATGEWKKTSAIEKIVEPGVIRLRYRGLIAFGEPLFLRVFFARK